MKLPRLIFVNNSTTWGNAFEGVVSPGHRYQRGSEGLDRCWGGGMAGWGSGYDQGFRRGNSQTDLVHIICFRGKL